MLDLFFCQWFVDVDALLYSTSLQPTHLRIHNSTKPRTQMGGQRLECEKWWGWHQGEMMR